MVAIQYDCPRGQSCTEGLIADPYIHINGCNSVWLSAGSALYCGLIEPRTLAAALLFLNLSLYLQHANIYPA